MVLYTGALLASKGVDHLFAAIPHVLAEVPDAFFLVVGYPVEESRDLVARLGVAEHCHFAGQVDYFELPDYLHAGDVAVDPKPDAAGEASGKIINYMGGGLPVACFDNLNNRPFPGRRGAFAAPPDAALAGGPSSPCCATPRPAPKRAPPPGGGWRRSSPGDAGGRLYEEVFTQVGGRGEG